MIDLFIHGIPRPQGSKTPMGKRGKHYIMVESNPNTKPWRESLAYAVKQQIVGPPLNEALVAGYTFWFPRPKSHYKSNGALRPNAPRFYAVNGKNDTEKLIRAVNDALTGVLWRDDGLICGFAQTWKLYGDTPGMRLQVWTSSEFGRWEI